MILISWILKILYKEHILVLWLEEKREAVRDFRVGPVVKNLPSNAGDEGLIPGWGTKIPQAETKTQCSQINK